MIRQPRAPIGMSGAAPKLPLRCHWYITAKRGLHGSKIARSVALLIIESFFQIVAVGTGGRLETADLNGPTPSCRWLRSFDRLQRSCN